MGEVQWNFESTPYSVTYKPLPPRNFSVTLRPPRAASHFETEASRSETVIDLAQSHLETLSSRFETPR